MERSATYVITERGCRGNYALAKLILRFFYFRGGRRGRVTKTTFPPTPQLRPRSRARDYNPGRLKVFDGNSEGGRISLAASVPSGSYSLGARARNVGKLSVLITLSEGEPFRTESRYITFLTCTFPPVPLSLFLSVYLPPSSSNTGYADEGREVTGR